MKKLLFVLFIFFAVAVSGCAAVPYAIEGAGFAGSFFSSQRKNSSSDSASTVDTVDTVRINSNIIVKVEKEASGEFALSAYRDKKYIDTVFASSYDKRIDDATEIIRFFRSKGIDLGHPATVEPAPPVADKATPPPKISVSEIPTMGFH